MNYFTIGRNTFILWKLICEFYNIKKLYNKLKIYS